MKKINLNPLLQSSLPSILQVKNVEYYIDDTNKDYKYVSISEFTKEFIEYAYDYYKLDIDSLQLKSNVDDYTLSFMNGIQVKLSYKNPTETYRVSIYTILEEYLREYYMYFIHKNLDEDTLYKKVQIMYNTIDSVDITLNELFDLCLDFVLDTKILGIIENNIDEYGSNFNTFNLYPIIKYNDIEAKDTLLKGIPLFFIHQSELDNEVVVLDTFTDFKDNLFCDCVYSDMSTQCIIKLRQGNKLLDIKPEHQYRILNHIKTLI